MKRSYIALAAAASVAIMAGPALAADFIMKVSAPVPPTEKDVIFAWMTELEKRVESASVGRIDVQLYPANQLGSLAATVEGVSMGTIEVNTPIIGFLGSLDPRFSILDAAGVFDDEAHAMRTFLDPEFRSFTSDFGADARIEPLAFVTSGQAVVVSKKPIETLEDFQGLKMRTGGATPLLNRPLEVLGVSPQALSLGEVLPALQTGTIDASSANMSVLNGFKFFDVAPEASYLPGNFTIIGVVASKDFMDTIGPDLAQIVRDEAVAALSVHETYRKNGPPALEAAWQSNGGTIRRFDDAQTQAYLDTVRPVVEEVVGADPQMKATYDALVDAAERNR